MRRWMAILLGAGVMAGCRGGAAKDAEAAVRVDSARAIPRALAAFRGQVPEVRELGGAFAENRDSLVAGFVAALERSDTAAFAPMAMNAAEFAWLYYADDPQSKPPYELPPDLMWYQRVEQGERGMSRALQRFGGRELEYRGYACADSLRMGANRVWRDCRLDVVGKDGTRAKVRLFGGIVERGGRFKFLSYANEL